MPERLQGLQPIFRQHHLKPHVLESTTDHLPVKTIIIHHEELSLHRLIFSHGKRHGWTRQGALPHRGRPLRNFMLRRFDHPHLEFPSEARGRRSDFCQIIDRILRILLRRQGDAGVATFLDLLDHRDHFQTHLLDIDPPRLYPRSRHELVEPNQQGVGRTMHFLHRANHFLHPVLIHRLHQQFRVSNNLIQRRA